MSDRLDEIRSALDRQSNPGRDDGRWLIARVEALERALAESVTLQSHYAKYLNEWDGGKRIVFNSAEEWIERLAALDSARAEGEGER